MDEKKKTSIKIDPEIWKEAKIEAIRRDMEVSNLVENCLKKELGLNKVESLEKLRKSTQVK